MKTIYQTIQDRNIRFLDHSKVKNIFSVPNQAITSFAVDDAIATTVGKKAVPATIRIWVHEPTLVLGIPDSRLPYIEQGISYAQEKLKHVVIRNSGGLAVLLDHGVLNMSIIVENDGHLSIHEGYNMMYRFIQELFCDYTTEIKAYEIIGSYCPGDYDLSINGIKFAGISQRRVRNGVAIQVYLDIEGSSYHRAGIVKKFYQLSKQEEITKYHYPDVDPSVMSTISDLVSFPFTVTQVIENIKELLQRSYNISETDFLPQEEELFLSRLEQMKKRNERLQLNNTY